MDEKWTEQVHRSETINKLSILVSEDVICEEDTMNKIENGNGECVKETTTRP